MEKSVNVAQKPCNLLFVNKIDVISVVNGISKYHRVVNFKTGKSFENIPFVKNSIEYSSQSNISAAGTMFTNRVIGILAGDSDNIPVELEKIKNQHLIISFSYTTGEKKIIGSEKNPVTVSYSYSETDSGYRVEFMQKNIHPAYILEV